MRRVDLAIAVIVVGLGACGSSSARATLPDVNSLTCSQSAPVTPQPSSLSALAQVASVEHQPLLGRMLDHGHGSGTPAASDEPGRAVPVRLVRELRAATAAACALRTTAAAARAGYVWSSAVTQGVGTHWTNWRLVGEPFDPARPSMLLYAKVGGHETLVGFSYWVRTTNPNGPAGFTGTSDHWHRHFGLCFDRTGLLERESVRNPRACTGTWLNGRDLWMLHAWIVPGHANVSGIFAAINPQLCSRTAPDIERCPGFG